MYSTLRLADHPVTPTRFQLIFLFVCKLSLVGRRILIDTGEANKPEYVSLLRETLEQLKAHISKVIITHWHHDHIGGLEGVCSLYPSECDTLYVSLIPYHTIII